MSRAYHLRPNKFIDRSLFVDLLRTLQLENIQQYVYIGLGGPFLDDMRVMHHGFAFERMISLEESPAVYARQALNAPCSNLQLLHTTLDAFVGEYEFDGPTIIWIDYESNAFEAQLSEAKRIIRKLDDGDVFRITMKADPGILPKFQGASRSRSETDRRNAFVSMLGKFGPSYDLPPSAFDENIDLSRHLKKAILGCAYEAREGLRSRFVPLFSTVYRDTTRMLTLTGIVSSDPAEYLKRVERWSVSDGADGITEINSPTLSAAERLQVERVLPCDVEALKQQARFVEHLSRRELEGLVRFYRHLPHFHRTTVIT